MKINLTFFFIKTGILIGLVSLFPYKWMILAAILITLVY